MTWEDVDQTRMSKAVLKRTALSESPSRFCKFELQVSTGAKSCCGPPALSSGESTTGCGLLACFQNEVLKCRENLDEGAIRKELRRAHRLSSSGVRLTVGRRDVFSRRRLVAKFSPERPANRWGVSLHDAWFAQRRADRQCCSLRRRRYALSRDGSCSTRRNFSKLRDRLDAFDALVENHYRYYQFCSNMLVAVVAVFLARATHLETVCSIDRLQIALLMLGGVFLAASRDTLGKYYGRATQLLGTRPDREQGHYDDERISSRTGYSAKKGAKRPESGLQGNDHGGEDG